ncbi:VacJ family lipoprotein [Francisella philomiragia]|uniref:MlaA family lipoprotein n=1 Tax=Francisella philomiragia TaxID=28110 RepID=UPI00351920B0
MKLKIKKSILLLATIIALSGCSIKWETPVNDRDPYENYNRKMFHWNNELYEDLTPVAKAYNFIMPEAAQTGIFNFFQNLFEPSRVANDLFQGEWSYAGDDSMRFLENTTLGVVGIFDVAGSRFGLPMRYHQDFAVTLHKWGVYKKGYASPYIVWPIFGPGTIEGVSDGVDAMFNPLSYLFLAPGVGTFTAYAVNYSVYGLYYTNQGVSYLPAYSNLEEVSVDPYTAMRNAYIQNYDYGMAKVLKQKDPSLDGSQNDKAILSVLGINDTNAKSEVAYSDESFVQASQDTPPVLKSSLTSVNKAAEV